MEIKAISQEEMASIYEYIIHYFKKQDFEPSKYIEYRSPYQLLIPAIVLVGCYTREDRIAADILVSTFSDPKKLAYAKYEDILKYTDGVRSAKKKARYIIDTARLLLERYDGNVPETADELQTFPGIGEMTARLIVLITCHDQVQHVDLHAARTAIRLGLARSGSSPSDVETEFAKYVSKELLPSMNMWMSIHGRTVCLIDDPLCSKCGLRRMCMYYNK